LETFKKEKPREREETANQCIHRQSSKKEKRREREETKGGGRQSMCWLASF